jgi:hypothetical protein
MNHESVVHYQGRFLFIWIFSSEVSCNLSASDLEMLSRYLQTSRRVSQGFEWILNSCFSNWLVHSKILCIINSTCLHSLSALMIKKPSMREEQDGFHLITPNAFIRPSITFRGLFGWLVAWIHQRLLLIVNQSTRSFSDRSWELDKKHKIRVRHRYMFQIFVRACEDDSNMELNHEFWNTDQLNRVIWPDINGSNHWKTSLTLLASIGQIFILQNVGLIDKKEFWCANYT